MRKGIKTALPIMCEETLFSFYGTVFTAPFVLRFYCSLPLTRAETSLREKDG